MTEKQPCRLCGQEDHLVESHIIPKFVVAWLKDTSATGYLRHTPIVNRRCQDSAKMHMLCPKCEGMFSQWETLFAKKIFHPHNRRESSSFRYGSWLLKFAASVSWRALTWYIDVSTEEVTYTDSAMEHIGKALKTWKEFLLGQRPHPGSFEQHIFFVDIIESASKLPGLPVNLNRYLTRSLEINIGHLDGDPQYVYVKMGKVILLGFIHCKHPEHWEGTKIRLRQGKIGGNVVLPLAFYHFLRERASLAQAVHGTMSKKQKEIIHASYQQDMDRAAKSQTLQATHADVQMFGKDAVFKKDRRT